MSTNITEYPLTTHCQSCNVVVDANGNQVVLAGYMLDHALNCVNTLADIPAPSKAKLAALLAACEDIYVAEPMAQLMKIADLAADFRAERSES